MTCLRSLSLLTLLLAAVSAADPPQHSGDPPADFTPEWRWVDVWSVLLTTRRNLNRQAELLDTQETYRLGNDSLGLPNKLELESDEDEDVTSAAARHRLASETETRHRDQAVAEAIGPYITPIANKGASKECLASSMSYLLNIFKEPWAMQMFDATGKMPDGIFQGNLNPFGNWDECLNATGFYNDLNNGSIVEKSFSGKYCLTILSKYPPYSQGKVQGQQLIQTPPVAKVGIAPFIPFLPDQLAVVTTGVCFPSTCTAEELGIGLTAAAALANLKVYAYPIDFMCYTQDEKAELSSSDVVMIVILALAGFCMLVGTVVDVVAAKAATSDQNWWSPVNALLRQIVPPGLRRFFLAFSVYTNGRKLLDTSSSSGTLDCLHGIRFLSLTWVVLGHTYAFIPYFKFQNVLKVYGYFQDVAFMAISNATVSVDSFFFLSGLLVSYIAMRNIERAKGKFNIVMFYVHRYIRLTPVMMMVIGFVATLYLHLGSGPYWGSQALGDPLQCQKYWWRNMLYINNLTPNEEMCLGQTWYLANDMQMYIFSPLVLLPLYYWPALGQLWLIFLVCFFTGINAMVTAVHKIGPNGALPGGDDFFIRYMRPWCRAGPYLVGLYLGWILHKTRGRKVSLPIPVVAMGWITASLTACLIVYGLYGVETVPPKTTSIIYGMLNRTAWSICLAWVVFACVNGYGGVINSILSWKAFIPFSRLTYTGYLVSIDIQMYYWATMKSPMYLDQTVLVYTFLASLPVIFAVALLFSLAFESPMLALEKMIFPQPSRSASSHPKATKTEPVLPAKDGEVNKAFEASGEGPSNSVESQLSPQIEHADEK